jgi:hypothetical protein
MLSFSGCSKNVFTIGYEASSCENSKSLGVCGSPKDISKYKTKIKKVQSDYLHSLISTTLYFAISPEGWIGVKEDREGHFQPYKGSKWERIINDKLAKNKKQLGVSSSSSSGNMVAVNNSGDDLSIKFQRQGDLIRTRTKLGNVIRDNGNIQQTFIETYQDKGGDLISGHEVYVVTKDPKWVVGEDTPKGSRLDSVPTPISTELFNQTESAARYSNNLQKRRTVKNPRRTYSRSRTSSDMKVINDYVK